MSNKPKSDTKKVDEDDITAIIPIKNEKQNIQLINKNTHLLLNLGIKIIIIDDHSEDGTLDELKERLKNASCTFLKAEGKGKYTAILQATQNTNNNFLLLLDADVVLQEETIKAILNLPVKYDWITTPIVHPLPRKLWHYWVYFEQIILQRAATIFYELGQPIVTSGACARVNREHYQKILYNKNVESGGDMLIMGLTDSRRQQMLPTKDALETDYPTSIKKLIAQRRRWFGNNRFKNRFLIKIAGGIFWSIFLLSFPASIFLGCCISASYLWTNLPILAMLYIFLARQISLKSFASALIYYTGGFLYQSILLFLIIFGFLRK